MASIGGLTSSSSTSTSGLQGYGGLASGIDRDSIIEQLVSGTQSKIDAKNQEKTSLQWEQELIQSITDKIYDFTQKYASYTSSTNLLGTTIFSRTDISIGGDFADFLSVSGSTQTSDLIEILGVKQLSQKATMTSVSNASDRTLELSEIFNDLDETTSVNMVAGEKITLELGNKKYTVELLAEKEDGTVLDYSTPQGIVEALNASLAQVSTGDTSKLSDSMMFTLSGGDKLAIQNMDKAGNSIEIVGGTSDVLQRLGFLTDDQDVDDLQPIGSGKLLTASNAYNVMEEQSIAKQLGGQSISFVYNGTVKWIEMPSEDELAGKTMDDVKNYLQSELDTAFGRGRVSVNLTQSTDGTKSSLSFSTTVPKTVNGQVVPGDPDQTSTISISAATGNLLGKNSLLGVEAGESNRLNLSSSIKDSGLVGMTDDYFDNVPESEALLTVNGVVIEGITADSSINDIMEAINNNEKAGVTISYQQNTDKFIVTSTQNGASGQVKLEGAIANALFGTQIGDPLNAKVTQGKDAIFAVRYAGSDEVTEIVRDSNTLSIDGLNITANKTFGYDSTGKLEDETKSATFTASVDTDKATEAVKAMVDEFNEILETINKEVQTKPNRDYEPLTTAQKNEMSENEIELWEEKAKEGLLFADTDLKSLTDSLRFVIPTELMMKLGDIGISTSDEYSDNGKLVFDESKFKAALESNPEEVRLLFSASSETNEDGTSTKGGLMTNMKTILDRYAGMTGSTKGILVERAGSEHSLLSTLDNSILDQINEIDEQIDRLMDQLTSEQDRYISQFTQLETLVAQMNSQSSYISSMFAQQ